jgi:hypothetical protein
MPSGAPQLIRRAFLCAALTSIVIPATAQADLVFSPDAMPVSFGNTTVMNSTERTLTLTNTSTSTAVNINGMLINGPGANHFSTGPSLCPPTLSPSASCNFTIRFNPSQTGTFNNPQLQLQINHNASNPTPLTRQLTGTGVPANLAPSPNPVDFETVLIDDGGEPRLIQVQNAGAANVQVTQIDINGPDASAFRSEGGCMGQTISPGQNCVFPIRFEPREDRVHNATLHIRVGGADFPVALTGVGGVSQVALAPNPLDFGNVAVGSSATATVTARSTGNAPFESIVAILSGGDVDDLRIVKDMCGLRILIPTQQCSVTLRFTPSDAGPAEAGLALIGTDRPVIAMVRGNGTPAATPPPLRKVRVEFSRKSGAARIKHGRVRLGTARCKDALTCTATVRTRFTVNPSGAGRSYLVQGRTRRWTLPRKRPVSVPVPRGVPGTLSKMIVTVRATAPGYAPSKQRKILRLKPAKSRDRSR